MSVLRGTQFNVDAFHRFDNSYKATEETIKAMRNQDGVESFIHKKKDRAEYLFNKEFRTCVILVCVAKQSVRQHIKKK